jgi:hypothetical protein
MRSMISYTKAAMERAMKVQEVILRAMAKRLRGGSQRRLSASATGRCDAGGRATRSLGFAELFDRRRGKPSPKRVPLATLERVLELYRERYFDLNVQHFHEKLTGEHQIELSYSWVKAVLQGAGGA